MIRRWLTLVVALSCLAPIAVRADECRAEIVDGGPEGIDPSIVKELSPRHVKLRVNDEFDLCEIWTTRSWKLAGEGKPPAAATPILYPLMPGSLVGVLRLSRTCYDLRDQEIPAGIYTLRYAVQPDLESHLDSHESRDFLLLLSPSVDKSPAPILKPEQMIALSAETIQTMHPAFLPLLKPVNPERDEAVRRDDRDPNGWVLLLSGKNETNKKIPMEIIVLRATTGG